MSARRRLLVIAVVACAALGFAGRASADSLYWNFDAGTTQTTFGPNTQIVIDQGDIGNGNLILGTFNADIYIVPAGSVSNGSKLQDVSGAPNTIQTDLTDGLFDSEPIGNTAPTGNIGPGTYDVVYDDNQDGIFEDGEFIDPDAFTVSIPSNVPPLPGGLGTLKANAQAEADKGAAAAKGLSALFAGYELWNVVSDFLDADTGTLLVNLYMNYLCNYITPSIDGSPVTPWCPTVGIEDRMRLEQQTVLLQLNEARHWAGIAADPPDPNYQDPPTLTPMIASNPASGDAVDVATAAYVSHEKVTEAASEALLHAIERYQGAQNAGDGPAALMQAREIESYAATTAAELRDSNPLIDGLLSGIASSGRDVLKSQDTELAVQQRLQTTGVTTDEYRQLRNLGLSDSDIQTATSRFEQGDFTIVTGGAALTSAFDDLKSQNAATASSLDTLQADMAPIVSSLVSQGFDVSPQVVAGGPYSGTAGTAVSLHATVTDPAGGGTVAWDLNGDGNFDDATGADASYTWTGPYDGPVGVKVTDPDGRSAVDYTHATIAATNHLPVISAVTPQPGAAIDVGLGQTQAFHADVTDQDADPVTISWLLDGQVVATGADYTYTAAGAGPHTLQLSATDGIGTTSGPTWALVAAAPDADGDGWQANVDCNDQNPNVNPGHAEVVGNGIDDDCNPATPDSGSPPTAAFTFGAAVAGQAVTFTDGSTDPNDDITGWSWDFGDLSPASTLQNPTHTYPATGTYTVTLTVTDSAGHTSTATHDVTVSPGPTAAFSFAPPAPVAGAFVQFTDTSNDPAGTVKSWSWEFGDGNVSTEQNPVHAYLLPGSYDVTLTITDSLGLVTSVTQTVGVGVADAGTAPVANFTPQGAVDAVDAAAATAGGSVSGPTQCCHAPISTLIDGTINDQWWSADRSAGTAITVTLPSEGPVEGVRLAGQGSGWWEMIKDFDVAVSTTSTDPSAFTTVFSGTTTWTSGWQEFRFPQAHLARYVEIVPHTTWNSGACCYSLNGLQVLEGTKYMRSVSFTDASQNAVSTSWDFGDGGTSTDTNPSHVYAAPGDYTVELTVSSSDARRDTISKVLHVVGPVPSFSTSAPTGVPGHSLVFTDTSTYVGGSFASRVWDFGDGTTNTSAEVAHTFASAGVYAVKLTVTDSNGISDSTTQNVTVSASGAPAALFDSTPTGGVYDVGSAALGASVAAPTQSAHSPVSTLIDGDASDQWWSADRSAGTAIVDTLARPEYVDGVRLAGEGCCWWEMIKDFDVAVSDTTNDPSAFTTVASGTTVWQGGWQEFRFSQPYLAKYVEIVPHSVWNNGACCYSLNGLQVLTGADSASPTFAFTNLSANATSYSWDFGDGGTSTDASPSHTYAAPGTYTVTLTANGPGGSATYSENLLVRGATFTYAPSAPTLDDYVVFDDTTQVNEQSRSWDFGDGATSTSATPAHEFSSSGPQTVTLTVTDVNGNKLTDTQTVDVAADSGPVASFAPQGDANAAELETGATVTAYSSAYNSDYVPQSMLDRTVDHTAPSWSTGNGTGLATNHFAKIKLAPGGPWSISHFDVMPRPDYGTQRVRDFEVWVSTTTDDDSAFHKVLTATTANNGNLQRFDLPKPVLATYVEYRPLDNWGHDTCCISTQQFRASTGQISEHTVTFQNLSRGATSYMWDFGDGTTSTDASPTHTYASAGDYTVTLTADAGGATSTFSLVQHVLDPLTAASVDDNVPAPNEGQSVTFTATPPANLPGAVVDYHWAWGDGRPDTDTTGPSTTHAFPDNGDYTVTVTVTDKYLRTAQATMDVPVANVAPSLELGANRTIYEANILSFGYPVSDPGASEALKCTTDYGDGTPVAASSCGSFSHDYGPGATVYTATVTVKDKDGASTSDSIQVTTMPRAQTGYASTDFVQAGVPSAPRSGCCGPIGLAFDSSNRLFVGDYANGYIYVFDAAGGAADNAHKLPNAVGCSVAGLAFSKSGRLYAARQGCSDVVEVSPADGHIIRTVATGISCATGLATDPLSGDLFVSMIGCRGGLARISHFEDAGPVQVSYYGSGAGLGGVDGVTIAPNGTIYVESNAHPIALAGTDQPNAGAVIGDYGYVNAMDGIAVAQGTSATAPFIFANRNDGIITKVDLSTTPATDTDIFKGGSRGDFVAVGPDGCLYATQSDRVVKVTNADGTCSLAGTSALPQLGLAPGHSQLTAGSTATLTGSITNVALPAGTLVTFTVTGANPQTGTAIAGTDGVATFTYSGAKTGNDTIVATATADGVDLTSNPVTVTWTDRAPVAQDGTLELHAGTSAPVTLSATDADGDALTYTVVAAPQHGTLSGSGANLTFTADSAYSGTDSFTFKANDGTLDSNVATVSITIDAVNRPPVAADQSVATDEDTALGITLGATDPDADALTYAVATQPEHGTLSGTAPNLTYTADDGYLGPDSFTFTANDGKADSNTATVSISVGDLTGSLDPSGTFWHAVNESPPGPAIVDLTTASPAIQPGDAIQIRLYTPTFFSQYSCSGPFITPDDVPGAGVFSSTNTLLAVSAQNRVPDQLPVDLPAYGTTFKTYYGGESEDIPDDFALSTKTAPVGVRVPPGAHYLMLQFSDTYYSDNCGRLEYFIGRVPTAADQQLKTPQDTAKDVTLSATDHAAGDQLDYEVVDGPAHGTLSGTAPNLTYTPAAGFHGTDSFTFDAKDGLAVSNVATVSIAVNGTPTAVDDVFSTRSGTALTLPDLTANDTDPEGDPLTVVASSVTAPAHGTLAGGVYTPDHGFVGDDSFRYAVTDGFSVSAPATVTIHVLDSPPAGAADDYSGHFGKPISVAAPGVLANDTDPDGDALTASGVSTQPQHGSVSLNADGSFVYTPAAGYVGDDSFAYTPNDGVLDGAPAVVTLHLTDAPPVAAPDALTLDQDTSAGGNVLANDSDPDGDALAVALFAAPQHGSATLAPDGSFTYTPAPGYYGPDAFTYLLTDGALSVPGTVSVTVKEVNRPPTVTLAPAGPVDEGAAPIELTASAHDPDTGQTLTTTWTTDVGTLTPSGDTASFSADDGPATAHVTVTVCDDGDPVLCAHDSQPVAVQNVAPAVTASADPASQFWGLPVQFTATAADPSKADTAAGLTYAWSFGASTLSAEHAYPAPGSYSASFSATDKDGGIGKADASVTVLERTTSLAFTAPLTQPFGPTVLSARLSDTVDAATAELAGRTIAFTAGGQTFTAVTDATGAATVAPAPFLLSGPVAVHFAGDDLYLPSDATAQLQVTNPFGSSGFFTVGDLEAKQGAAVTFWGSQWWKLNPLSTGSAPSSFKGFVDAAPPAGCGGNWTSRPGNSSSPPASLGGYVAVVVPTRVGKSGSSIAGDAPKIVAVRVAPGYGPNPGHSGSGTIVGTVCG